MNMLVKLLKFLAPSLLSRYGHLKINRYMHRTQGSFALFGCHDHAVQETLPHNGPLWVHG